jgi:hypothetical protein
VGHFDWLCSESHSLLEWEFPDHFEVHPLSVQGTTLRMFTDPEAFDEILKGDSDFVSLPKTAQVDEDAELPLYRDDMHIEFVAPPNYTKRKATGNYCRLLTTTTECCRQTIADRRPRTDHRSTTADCRPPTADRWLRFCFLTLLLVLLLLLLPPLASL